MDTAHLLSKLDVDVPDPARALPILLCSDGAQALETPDLLHEARHPERLDINSGSWKRFPYLEITRVAPI